MQHKLVVESRGELKLMRWYCIVPHYNLIIEIELKMKHESEHGFKNECFGNPLKFPRVTQLLKIYF